MAMLSFSTKGSAAHADVDKVVSAVKIAKEKAPGAPRSTARCRPTPPSSPRSASGSARAVPVAGKANVLVFPDLDAGNIGYKLTERLAGAEAVGPIVQGLRTSRSATCRAAVRADDMVNVAAICSLMA